MTPPDQLALPWAEDVPAPLAAWPADPALPLNALVIDGEDPSFQPVGAFEADPVAVAERLLGVPHVPGARTSRGKSPAASAAITWSTSARAREITSIIWLKVSDSRPSSSC